MSYEAILFDMDGVIIDTRPAVTTFWYQLAEEHGIQLTEADFQRYIYGCPANYTLDRFFPQFDDPQRRRAFHQRLDEYELDLTYTEIPGAVAFLRALQQRDIPTALVTSANRYKVAEVMDQLGLEGLFSTRVTVEEIRRGKPYPDCYTLAAERLGRPTSRCLVFEDAVSGIKAGVAAGARCIGVLPPEEAGALREAGASWTVPDLTAVSVQITPDGSGISSLFLQFKDGTNLPIFNPQPQPYLVY